MTSAEILAELEEQLRLLGAPGFEFSLVRDAGWFGKCPVSGEEHKHIQAEIGGYWCTSCRRAYIADVVRDKITKDNLTAAAHVMLRSRSRHA